MSLEQPLVQRPQPTERDVALIVRQYTLCTSLLEELFKLAPDECWTFDGVGCCASATKTLVEKGLQGPAYETLMRLRGQRSESYGHLPRDIEEACPYHTEQGCVLGELKSPLCISHYCRGKIEGVFDSDYVYDTLKRILEGNLDPETGLYHPEKNWKIVLELRRYVKELIFQLEYRPGCLRK